MEFCTNCVHYNQSSCNVFSGSGSGPRPDRNPQIRIRFGHNVDHSFDDIFKHSCRLFGDIFNFLIFQNKILFCFENCQNRPKLHILRDFLGGGRMLFEVTNPNSNPSLPGPDPVFRSEAAFTTTRIQFNHRNRQNQVNQSDAARGLRQSVWRSRRQ